MQMGKLLIALTVATFTSIASADVFVTAEPIHIYWLPDTGPTDVLIVSNALMYEDPNTMADAALRIDLTSGETFEGHDGYTSIDGGMLYIMTDIDMRYGPMFTYDTYIGLFGGTASPHGGAVELGGGPLSLSAPNISIEWDEGVMVYGGGGQIGNISLTPDSMGTWSFIAYNDQGQRFEASGDVVNGYMLVPEPASLAVLGFGVPLLLRRVR